MSSASKRQDDGDAENTQVPPYPAEVAGTWQAFRVTLRDTAVDDPNDAAPNDAAPNDAAPNDAAPNDEAPSGDDPQVDDAGPS